MPAIVTEMFCFILLQSFTTTCFGPYGPSSGGLQHLLSFYGTINTTTDQLFCDCLGLCCEHSVIILQFLQFKLKFNLTQQDAPIKNKKKWQSFQPHCGAGVDSASNRWVPGIFLAIKGGRRARLTATPLSTIRFSTKCVNLHVSPSYRSLRPVTGIVLRVLSCRSSSWMSVALICFDSELFSV
jgi:hypothetical protein